jgi:hypothetical protein
MAEKPSQVRLAVNLVWISFVIGFLTIPFRWNSVQPRPSVPGILTDFFFSFGLLAILLYKISEGRNWARVLFLVLEILGTILIGGVLISGLVHLSRSALAVSVVQGLLQAWACVLLFTRPSGKYFTQYKHLE